MKINKLFVPVSMTAALAGLVACDVSCAKKSNAPQNPQPAPPTSLPTNSVTDNTTNAMVAAHPPVAVITNAPATSSEITNPPPAETTTKAPETTADTNLPGHNTVVEMPTNAPVAPTHFYAPSVATNTAYCRLSPVDYLSNTNFYVALYGGYDHFNHGDNHDSYSAGVTLYAYGDGLRESAGNNAWLIPDADLRISSGEVAKPDNVPHPGSDDGLTLRADFTWPWFRWSANQSGDPDSFFPFARPLAMALGPTVNVGFDHLYDEYKYRFADYAGLRLTFNHSGFIEYTVGNTLGLAGVRQQVVAELPFYESRDSEVRYYLRGLWNRGSSDSPDILEGGVFIEMPLGLLISPEKWGDLVPFLQ